jgi:pyruvate,water dikinase
MATRRSGAARPGRRAGAALALAASLLAPAAAAGAFSSVEPRRVLAGAFFSGASLRVSGSIGERSQVAIRVTGPLEHHTFNRRGKIAGIIWGGVEHVTFQHAPSLYAVQTSAALGAMAPPELRERLRLGYQTLAAHMEVSGTGVDKGEMIGQLVLLKEREGLYRQAPGAVHLADAQGGRRAFEASIRLPATVPSSDLEVAVFELADGALVGQEITRVQLERVGMPAFLFRLAHQHGSLFGLLAVLALMATGVAVDLLGSRRSTRHHPAVVMLVGLAHEVDDAVLAGRRRPRSPAEVERIHEKYKLFRTLLALNNELLENLSELEEESSWTSFRHARVRMGIRALFDGTADMVRVLNELTGNRQFDLANVVSTLRADVWKLLEKASEQQDSRFTLDMAEIRSETAAVVGDKAVNLARVECDLGERVPAFFVVTIEAYRELLDAGGLATQLRTLLAPARLDVPEDFQRRCEMAQELVREAPVPPSVVEAIEAACAAAGLGPDDALAVRSSAAGEGSALSFAGQFESYLNVAPSGVVAAWKRVVGSRFSPRAVFYRRAAGVAEVDTPMAVLVQRMVRAEAAGVVHTRRPGEAKGGLMVTAVRGLGPEVSAGVAAADELVLSRKAPHRVLERRIARKPSLLVRAEGGGLARQPVADADQLQPALSEEQAARLAAAAMGIEHYFGTPQDIEWVLDEAGQLVILQARPLPTDRMEAASREAPPDARVLARGAEAAWPGRAVGPVHVARTPGEEEATPLGSVLVVPHLLPDSVRVLPRVSGVVVERGTVTGHSASVLREFRVPSLFGVAGALDLLTPGREVSLDAGSHTVFDGALWPELRGRLPVEVLGRRPAGLPDLLAGKLTKLSASAFLGTWACRSVHDVIRFAHEMAIHSMFDIGDRLLDSPVGGVKRLECPPPVYVHVVDLGGGLRPEVADRETVTPDEVLSLPFQGLWRGLGDARFEPQRSERPGPFGSVLTSTMVTSGARRLGSPNYACISEGYLNLSSRQAYHFAVVDSFVSAEPNGNHVSMRLRGGGAAAWQRKLRADFAAEVLRSRHFTVSVMGDLLTGWVRGLDAESSLDRLATVGHLLRFLSRLDMFMNDESDVRRFSEQFAAAEASVLAEGRAGEKVAALEPAPGRPGPP